MVQALANEENDYGALIGISSGDRGRKKSA